MGRALLWSVRAYIREIRDPSGPDCCNEGLDAHELDHPLHVVGEHAKAHLGSDVPERFGQEMRTSHPGFEGAEDMLDGPATDAHGIGQQV